MRCDCCPLSSDEDVCPEAEGAYGIDHSDGVSGCNHPRNWVEKRDREYSEYVGDMGVELSFSEERITQFVDICKHSIGLDYKNPYHRHGKAFYKPYRNYYCTRANDKLWEDLMRLGLASVSEEHNGFVDYYLTQAGIEWLGRQLNITIKGSDRE